MPIHIFSSMLSLFKKSKNRVSTETESDVPERRYVFVIKVLKKILFGGNFERGSGSLLSRGSTIPFRSFERAISDHSIHEHPKVYETSAPVADNKEEYIDSSNQQLVSEYNCREHPENYETNAPVANIEEEIRDSSDQQLISAWRNLVGNNNIEPQSTGSGGSLQSCNEVINNIESKQQHVNCQNPSQTTAEQYSLTHSSEYLSSASQQFEPGQFEIQNSLGKGTSGEVFNAILRKEFQGIVGALFPDATFEVAIKRLEGLSSQNPHITTELKIHKRVHTHPDIVSYIGSFENRDCTFIIMERLYGLDLKTTLRNYGRLTEMEVLCVMKHVFDVLRFMHDLGYAHLDIKPANIVFANKLQYPRNLKGPVRVLDFGLSHMDKNNVVGARGSPVYSPPEADMDSSAYCGAAADVWSAGIMMYELLSGNQPYKGRSFIQVTDDVLQKGELNLMHCPELPYVTNRLKRLIMGCLQIEPKNRYSAREAYDEILMCIVDTAKKKTFPDIFYTCSESSLNEP